MNNSENQIASHLIGDTSISTILAMSQIYSGLTQSKNSPIDLKSIKKELQKHSDSVKSGELDNLEEMLLYQSHLLHHIFSSNISKSFSAKTVAAMETFMRLALKAQAQSRSTISALADIKLSKSTAKIPNYNAVNQQINNSTNELLEGEI